MCLHLRLLVAVALFGAGAALTSPGQAQTNPNSGDIVKALTPTGAGVAGPSRGIRMVNPTPGTSATPAAAPATTATTTAEAAPSVSLGVQFEKGSAQLSPTAIHTLNELGKALNEPSLAAYRFRIEGHTDTVGTAEYNKELSERRATAVLNYLETNFKISGSRLQAVGMGEQGLAVQTPDQTPEPRNRRVAVVNLGS